jgi:CO/xanthine dehydrogenase Mo-binding subunit
MPRIDVPSKVDGSAAFGIDVRVPGMLFAVIARCPFFGGKLQSFDASVAKSMPGFAPFFQFRLSLVTSTRPVVSPLSRTPLGLPFKAGRPLY